jgi:AcrR family transcriptional regulator
MTTTTTGGERRTGSETRAEILRVALALFTEKGFASTSTRDIAEALGITKSALYYHFRSKDAIVTSLVQQRLRELDELLEWVEAQPRTPDLLQRAALRWVDSTTPQRMQAILLAQAHQPVRRRLVANGLDVRTGFEKVVEHLTGCAPARDRLLARMAFDTVAAALVAARGTGAGSDEVIAAARRATIALTAQPET